MGALAAQRLRQEEPRRARHIESRGMKLHELQVGDPCSGEPPEHDAVAGGDRRVRGFRKHLPGTASGQEHRRGFDDVFTGRTGESRTDASTVPNNQVVGTRITLHAHPPMRRHAFPEGAPDFPPGGITRMQDAASTVCGLAAERQSSPVIAVETRAPLH